MTEKTAVNIHGKTYHLKSGNVNVDPEQLADYVDSKMQELAKTKTAHFTTDLAVLTALNIAGELMTTQKKYRTETEAFQVKVGSLIKTLAKEIESIEK